MQPMRTVQLRRLATAVALVGATLATAWSPPAAAVTTGPEVLYALTTDNALVRIDAATPGTVQATVALTGLVAGETVVGIDARPATAGLYALGSSGRLYTVNPATGALAPVGTGTPTPALAGTSFGVDFNPVPDRLRVVSDADQNLRVNPDTGTGPAATPTAGTQVDSPLVYATGTAGTPVPGGTNPTVVGSAYTNNTVGAASTTLYGIDAGLDLLVTQGSPNGAPVSPNSGQLFPVGPLGVDTTNDVGFDVSDRGTAFASLTAPGATSSSLYRVDLATGRATGLGAIGGGRVVRGLAVVLPDPVRRLAGATRFETAVAISQSSYPAAGSAGAVVLARSDDFADALTGTPLAAARNAPLLLSETAALNATTTAEVRRAAPAGATVYLVGGTAALSASVEASVRSLGYNAVRYGGADRYETAVQVASAGLGNPTGLLLASGRDFPDALAAGAAAPRVVGGAAVLLTDGDAQAPATAAYVAARGPTVGLVAVGGPAARAVPAAPAVVGADRYDTARLVAERFFASTVTVFGAASGEAFADALTGGAHAARLGGPLLLVQPNALPPVVRTYLAGRAATVSRGFLYGGSAAVSEPVRLALQDAITLGA